MSDKKKERIKLTGITLNLLYPDGHSRTVTLDPRRLEALFWSERAVKEILIPYYDKQPQPKGPKGVKVDKKHVEDLWESKDPDGFLPGSLAKTIDCIPE